MKDVRYMKSSGKTLIAATSTPLASIFGSGLLIIVPILAFVATALAFIAVFAVPAS